MKRILFILYLTFSCFVALPAQQVTNLYFELSDINPTIPLPTNPHAPILYPQATLEGHTLTIVSTAGVEWLQLRQNNTVVYQSVITGDGQIVYFPDTITGECELTLFAPSYIFSSLIYF